MVVARKKFGMIPQDTHHRNGGIMTYTEEQIQSAKILLEGLSVSGVDNCKRVIMLRQILDADQKEKSDDNC